MGPQPGDLPLPKEYAAAGVDEEREQLAFLRVMRPLLEKTRSSNPRVKSLAGVRSGHFATVLQLDEGPAIAITTDGVGTKILVARMAGRFDTIGIDCVANNVNDLICIGADPIAMLDYLAIDIIDEDVLEALAKGLALGADEAGIEIPGGEIAQVGAMLGAPSGYGIGPIFDLVGTAIGLLPPTGGDRKPRLMDGSAVVPGDLVVGLPSSGLHSNGFSLARSALFDAANLSLETTVPGSGRSLADELLEPTRIYVSAVRRLWTEQIELHGLVNISGGGLLNLLRLPTKVSYVLDALPEPPPIFKMIQNSKEISWQEMYSTFNMGIGACVLVPEAEVDRAVTCLRSAGEAAQVIGRVTDEPDQAVYLTKLGLVGRGDTFRVTDHSQSM